MNQNNEPGEIVFEGEEFQTRQSFQTPTPKIVQWAIKYSGGYVKDEKQANYVLLGFVALAIIVSIFLVSGGSSLGRSGKTPIPAGQNIPHTFSE